MRQSVAGGVLCAGISLLFGSCGLCARVLCHCRQAGHVLRGDCGLETEPFISLSTWHIAHMLQSLRCERLGPWARVQGHPWARVQGHTRRRRSHHRDSTIMQRNTIKFGELTDAENTTPATPEVQPNTLPSTLMCAPHIRTGSHVDPHVQAFVKWELEPPTTTL